MLFNSVEFFVFLAIVYSLYRLLPLRGQNWLLLFAGYVFYGWWDPRFLFLIAFSTTVDFWIGSMLGNGLVCARQRKIASVFILGAALLFLNVNWPALMHGAFGMAWAPTQLGLITIAGTAVVMLLANLSHASIAAMDEHARRKLLLFVTVGVNLGFLGSGLIDHSQKMTVAAIAMADMKVCAHRSYRVWIRRQSLSRPNMISILWRWR